MTSLPEIRALIEQLEPIARSLFCEPPGFEVSQDRLRQLVVTSWPIWSPGAMSRNVAGLRIIPGAPLMRWPVARGQQDCAETWGTGGPSAVPFAVYWGRLRLSLRANSLARKRAAWPGERERLEPLHRALGGDPEALDILGECLLSSALDELRGTPAEVKAAFDSGMLRRLDPSPVHVAFRDFVDQQLFTREVLEVPPNLGAWQGFALTLSFTRALLEENLSPRTASLGWRLLKEPPQFDFDLPFLHETHQSSGTGVLNDDVLARAMVAVSKHGTPEQLEEWSKEPLFQTVLAAVAKDRQGPWHLAYMEAAAAYDGLDQPEVAWNMLCAGAFWVNRRGGPWRPFFDAALALAKRRGWTDCAAALEDQAARAQLD